MILNLFVWGCSEVSGVGWVDEMVGSVRMSVVVVRRR